ncbi:fibronectin type III domain-containing protein [Micromonospora sp. NPDC093277]|uniref:fibronectin type III domain-containing protein n=1 Tax=Micromonospora sp. NPDC093277 TaxID=3364291 RepID=UPI0037F9145E
MPANQMYPPVGPPPGPSAPMPPVSGPPTPANQMYPPVGPPPGPSAPMPPVSGPPTPAYQAYPPVSGPPVVPPPVSGPPAGAPVSASPVPPWGMTVPPWSSAAPPQPLDRPVDQQPEPEESDETGPDPTTPADPVDAPGSETEDAGPRPLPVYDELLEFPEPARPEPPPGPAPYPQQGAWPAVPAPFHQPPAYPMPVEPEPRGRNRVVVAVVAGVAMVAVAAVVGVGVLVLNRGDAPPPAADPTAAKPKVSGPPPGDLRLKDGTTTITITWTDPTNGSVPFVVAGGQAGQRLGVMATVDAGETRYTVNGLSPKLDYCFTVLAVYSTDTYATSGQVCTDRGPGTPSR